MSDRKEPTLSMEGQKQEPIQSRPVSARPAVGAGAATAGATVKRSAPQDRPKVKPQPQQESLDLELSPRASSNQVVVKKQSSIFATILAVVAICGAGFSYFQLMQTQALLKDASVRIVDLEGRLAMTGDESQASSAAMQAKLKWADSEIRKLWGVSNDRNKKAIAGNKAKLDSIDTKMSKIEKKVDTGLAAEVKKQMRGITGEVVVLNELVSANQAGISSAERNAKKSIQEVTAMKKQVDNIAAKEAGLIKQVQTNTQSIEAIDSFRQSVNRQILELQSR